MMRPIMSVPPPGPNATITRMVRAGHSCAGAGAARPVAKAQAAKMASTGLFMAALSLVRAWRAFRRRRSAEHTFIRPDPGLAAGPVHVHHETGVIILGRNARVGGAYV